MNPPNKNQPTSSETPSNPLPQITVETLLADVFPYQDTPESRQDAARYLADRLDEVVGDDAPSGEFYPQGTKVALSYNFLLGPDAGRAGYRSYDGLVDVKRVTGPDQVVKYNVTANHRLSAGGRFERAFSMIVKGDDITAEITHPEKTGDEMQEASLFDMGDIGEYISGRNGTLHPVDNKTQEVVFSRDGSRARIVNKSTLRSLGKVLKLTR